VLIFTTDTLAFYEIYGDVPRYQARRTAVVPRRAKKHHSACHRSYRDPIGSRSRSAESETSSRASSTSFRWLREFVADTWLRMRARANIIEVHSTRSSGVPHCAASQLERLPQALAGLLPHCPLPHRPRRRIGRGAGLVPPCPVHGERPEMAGGWVGAQPVQNEQARRIALLPQELTQEPAGRALSCSQHTCAVRGSRSPSRRCARCWRAAAGAGCGRMPDRT
jgi:hypothetical protein